MWKCDTAQTCAQLSGRSHIHEQIRQKQLGNILIQCVTENLHFCKMRWLQSLCNTSCSIFHHFITAAKGGLSFNAYDAKYFSILQCFLDVSVYRALHQWHCKRLVVIHVDTTCMQAKAMFYMNGLHGFLSLLCRKAFGTYRRPI